MKNSVWYVYMIRCHDGSLYTGITTDVSRRFAEHREGSPKGAKYLKGRGPLTLVFSKKIGGKGLALKIERKIKQMTKAGKEALLQNNKVVSSLIREVKRTPPDSEK